MTNEKTKSMKKLSRFHWNPASLFFAHFIWGWNYSATNKKWKLLYCSYTIENNWYVWIQTHLNTIDIGNDFAMQKALDSIEFQPIKTSQAFSIPHIEIYCLVCYGLIVPLKVNWRVYVIDALVHERVNRTVCLIDVFRCHPISISIEMVQK